jgi:uncharacterized membrane protein YGL010W
MKTLDQHLSHYAAYHRDGRNIATHIIGIPLIVAAVEILASRPVVMAGTVPLTPAMLLAALATLFYLRLDLRFGVTMAGLLGLGAWAGLHVAALPSWAWAAAGAGAFIIGWIIQFIGHRFEGRKPAFLDDISGLLVGPLFIVAEIAFLLGLRQALARTLQPPPRSAG